MYDIEQCIRYLLVYISSILFLCVKLVDGCGLSASSRPLRWQLEPPAAGAAAGGQSLLCHLMTCNDYFLNLKITIATNWIEY